MRTQSVRDAIEESGIVPDLEQLFESESLRGFGECGKYRNKVGIDVAIEALRDCLRQRKATSDEIWKAAKVCRMTNVMRPYLEATA